MGEKYFFSPQKYFSTETFFNNKNNSTAETKDYMNLLLHAKVNSYTSVIISHDYYTNDFSSVIDYFVNYFSSVID